MYFLVTSYDVVAQTPDWIVIVSMVVPLSVGLGLYLFKTRHAKSWRNGVFPQELKPSKENFLEAYLALGAKLILLDYQSSKGKIQFINSYFERYFKSANYNFGDSLVFSLRYPIKSGTVTDWIKKQLITEGERSQIIYFLAGLAMVNGSLHRNELRFLQIINLELELLPENVSRIIAIYAVYQQELDNEKPKGKVVSDLYYFEILGVKPGCSQQEVKSAYRNLVKIHHPDRFANGSEVQQKIASEKFMQIQKAYDVISRKKI